MSKTKTEKAVAKAAAESLLSKDPQPTKDQRVQGRTLVVEVLRAVRAKHPEDPISRREVATLLAQKMGCAVGTANRAADFPKLRNLKALVVKTPGVFEPGPAWASIVEGKGASAEPAAAKAPVKAAAAPAKATRSKAKREPVADVKAEAKRLQKAHAKKSRGALAAANLVGPAAVEQVQSHAQQADSAPSDSQA